MVSGILRMGITFCVASIPTVIGTVIIKKLLESEILVMVGTVVIFMSNSIIGLSLVQVFIDALIMKFMMFKLQ